MKKIQIVAIALGCILLQGCGGAEGEAKKAVLENLKDPDSAKFGKFTQIDEQLACMTVNAKNSIGGYTGDEQALLKKVDGRWRFYTMQEFSHDTCIQMWPQVEMRPSAGERLKTACAEQRAMGEKYSKMSEEVCQFGEALSDDQKLQFVSSWENVKKTLSNLKSLEAERR